MSSWWHTLSLCGWLWSHYVIYNTIAWWHTCRHVDSAMNRNCYLRTGTESEALTWRVHCSTDCLRMDMTYDQSPIVSDFDQDVPRKWGQPRVTSHNVTRTHVTYSGIYCGETIFFGLSNRSLNNMFVRLWFPVVSTTPYFITTHSYDL